MRLDTQEERDRAIQDLIESTLYVDENFEPVEFDSCR
jgi:hypothetical protein